jgi:hypothetical protein
LDTKYKNIFWHQGVKIFEDDIINNKNGLLKISHLENDVTKALFNLFQYCHPQILGRFLKLLDIKDNPSTFDFDFQVTNSDKYRNMPNRVMLSLISVSTPRKSNPNYPVQMSRPDGCIFNKNNAILIEAKTQSPLIHEQIESHVKHYLGSATKQRTLTWEDISEIFLLKIVNHKSNKLDDFLVSHFCGLLELIGIAKFKGFSIEDFQMQNSLGVIPDEDYLDFKRYFHKKIDRFMGILFGEIKSSFCFKPFGYKISKINLCSPGAWSAFYYHNNEKNPHVNKYPNINFNFNDPGIELSINSEVKPSFDLLLSHIKSNYKEFDNVLQDLDGFKLSLYYKLQFLPMNNFFWNLVPGYPKELKNISSTKVLKDIDTFEKQWADFRNTALFEMESGLQRHGSGRVFNETELNFSKTHNYKPMLVLRFEKRYSAELIDKLKGNVVTFFVGEISKIKSFMKFIIG